MTTPHQVPLRIAFVSSSLGFGGATTFLCNIGRALQEQGAITQVLALEREHAFEADFASAGIPTFVQDERKYIYEDRLIRTLSRLAAFKPTAVIANLGDASYEVLRYTPAGVRRVGVIHADHKIFYDVAVRYAQHLDTVIGVSREIQHQLSAIPALKHTTNHFLTSGVTIAPKLHREPPSSDAPLRILYLGRLERPQKRVHLFPQILRNLQKSGIPFEWTIIGEGTERHWLKEQLLTTDPRQIVNVSGPIPNSAVGALLRKQDVFLLASDCEGLPISLLEAMAEGVVPVVSALDSGISDVVDLHCGIQVPPDEVDGYARAIVLLHQNRKQLDLLSKAAHRAVQLEYSSDAMSKRWIEALERDTHSHHWASTHIIRTPLFAANRMHYSPLARVGRRIMKRISPRIQ